jgi:hypothetical protein
MKLIESVPSDSTGHLLVVSLDHAEAEVSRVIRYHVADLLLLN